MGRNKYKKMPNNVNAAFRHSLDRNSRTYYMFYSRMTELYMQRYIINGLQDTVDLPTIMYGLMVNGSVCAFEDPVIGALCLMGTPTRGVDVYNYPTAYRIHTASGYDNTLRVSAFDPDRNGYVFYTNYQRTADIGIIMDYAERMSAALRSIDVNIANSRTTKFLGMPESQRLTLQNAIKDYDGNIPVILVDKDLKFGTEEYPIYDMTSPYVADKIWIHLQNLWNDYLTWLGIENGTNNKRERLVVDEVNSNMGQVEMSRNTTFQRLKTGCEAVNRMFGWEWEIEFNSHLDTRLNLSFMQGAGYGEIYSEVTGDGDAADRERGALDVLGSDRRGGTEVD